MGGSFHPPDPELLPSGTVSDGKWELEFCRGLPGRPTPLRRGGEEPTGDVGEEEFTVPGDDPFTPTPGEIEAGRGEGMVSEGLPPMEAGVKKNEFCFGEGGCER